MGKGLDPKGYNGVIKTHSFAPRELPEDYRAIFVFGDVVNAVLSFRNKRWDKGSLRNMDVYKPRFLTDVFRRDELGLEARFDSWVKENRYPVLLLRYEKMNEHERKISEFLNKEVKLLPWRSRTTKRGLVPTGKSGVIASTYASLIRKIDEMPDAVIKGTAGRAVENRKGPE